VGDKEEMGIDCHITVPVAQELLDNTGVWVAEVSIHVKESQNTS
jgi:hypothetical protein